MSSAADILRTKLDEKRTRVTALCRDLAVAKAELKTWEEAIELLAAVQPSKNSEHPSGPYLPHHTTLNLSTGTGKTHTVFLNRGLSDQWRNIFAGTAKFLPHPATLDDMEQIAIDLGTPVDRNVLRSQSSNYAGKGVLERVGQGAYRLTEIGAEQLGIKLSKVEGLFEEAKEIDPASTGEEGAGSQ